MTENELAALFDQKMVIQNNIKITINSLPNEMLRTVLAKFDVQQLITIRGVCKRWHGLIEDICREVKSILIEPKSKDENFKISKLSKRFNGLIAFSHKWIIFKVKSTAEDQNEISLSKYFCILLTKLLPQVQNFILNALLENTTSDTAENLITLLNHWSHTIVTLYLPSSTYNFPESSYPALSGQIDKLTALKRLHFLDFDFVKPCTLSRLEHCSISIFDVRVNKIVSHLEVTRCHSLHLSQIVFYDDMLLLAKYNCPLLKCVTHLSLLTSVKYEEHEDLSFIWGNFGALQMLDFKSMSRKNFNADSIPYIAKMTNLSQLSIKWLRIDLTTLAQTINFRLICNSVKILKMTHFEVINNGNDDGQFNGKQFCQVMSCIFPNLVQLTIKHEDQVVRDAIAENLGHFANLCKHLIV